MQLWNGLESIETPFAATSVAVGTFDGLHIGHQALIRQAVTDARSQQRPSVVLTFDRHPAAILAPDRVPAALTTPQQRTNIIAGLGVDHLVVARFDRPFRELSAEGFLMFVLHGVLGAKAVLVGEDFRFGRNQQGDTAYLHEAGERYGFTLKTLPAVLIEGERASSTRIRQLLQTGDLERAAQMLGRPYRLSGTVVTGQQLGRTLGYPTANLEPTYRQVIPANGVYAVWVTRRADETRHKGACSIGVRPTIGGGLSRTIETYLLDFSGDLYGEALDLDFVVYLRPEKKFDTLAALTEQMAQDVAQAEARL